MKIVLRRYGVFIGLIALVSILLLFKLLFTPKESGEPRLLFRQAQPTPTPGTGRTEIYTPEDRRLREAEVRPGIEYLRKNPLVPLLPHQEASFILDHDAATDTYIVHMILPEKKTVDEEIADSKRDALNWIRSQGVDPNTLKIEYR